jgi:hypothetical protein
MKTLLHFVLALTLALFVGLTTAQAKTTIHTPKYHSHYRGHHFSQSHYHVHPYYGHHHPLIHHPGVSVHHGIHTY